jgi:phage terminase large subunit
MQVHNDNNVELFPEVKKMPLFWANFTSKEKININPGGTYSGKTQSLVRVCLSYAALKYFPQGITICTGTLTKLKEDAISIFENLYISNKVLATQIKQYNRSDYKVIFKNGTAVKFTSFENPLQAEGAKCDILYICEAPRLSWDVAYRLIFRTNFKVFIDYNPYQNFWVDDKLINCKVNERTGKKEFSSIAIFRSWHIHNNFITQEKRDELENITDPDIWAVYARGLKGKLKGIVYPRFTPIGKIPEDCTSIIWGIDYGYTSDPTAIVKIGIKGNDRYIEQCYYEPCADAHIIKEVLKMNGWQPKHYLFSEHDKRIIRDLLNLGVSVMLANKKSKVSNISKVKTFNLYYVDSCPELKNEIENYKWTSVTSRITGDEVLTNTPQDGNDHLCDAFLYGIATHAYITGL